MGDTSGMRAAEAEDPGFIYRNGWTHRDCPQCGQVVYDGRWISPEDFTALDRIHRTSCAGGTP